MNHDQYDDGLVHSHNFACSERGRMARPTPPLTTWEEADHDEGLVHSHGWACSERGQTAHR